MKVWDKEAKADYSLVWIEICRRVLRHEVGEADPTLSRPYAIIPGSGGLPERSNGGD